MRVKIIKDHKQYSKGSVQDVSPNVGFGLIDSGYAIVSKDMTQSDIRTSNGNTTDLRTNKLGGRKGKPGNRQWRNSTR